jgi:hypothetical protein
MHGSVDAGDSGADDDDVKMLDFTHREYPFVWTSAFTPWRTRGGGKLYRPPFRNWPPGRTSLRPRSWRASRVRCDQRGFGEPLAPAAGWSADSCSRETNFGVCLTIWVGANMAAKVLITGGFVGREGECEAGCKGAGG